MQGFRAEDSEEKALANAAVRPTDEYAFCTLATRIPAKMLDHLPQAATGHDDP